MNIFKNNHLVIKLSTVLMKGANQCYCQSTQWEETVIILKIQNHLIQTDGSEILQLKSQKVFPRHILRMCVKKSAQIRKNALFVLIWAFGRYSCNLIPACFCLACPTWRLMQKCPERTTISPLFPRLKGFRWRASSFQLFASGGFEPAKVVIEQGRCLNRFGQPGRFKKVL